MGAEYVLRILHTRKQPSVEAGADEPRRPDF